MQAVRLNADKASRVFLQFEEASSGMFKRQIRVASAVAFSLSLILFAGGCKKKGPAPPPAVKATPPPPQPEYSEKDLIGRPTSVIANSFQNFRRKFMSRSDADNPASGVSTESNLPQNPAISGTTGAVPPQAHVTPLKNIGDS